MQLWTINKWLRWTGVRLFVATGKDLPTELGFAWVGWPGSNGWRRWEVPCADRPL
jgi:hypothetical protein